jgi:hypothetical protein
MNKILLKFLLVAIFSQFVIYGSANSQIFRRNTGRNVEKELFGRSIASKNSKKSKPPKSASKNRKKQEAAERKRKKEYEKSVKQSQKRTYDIQSPEVQARMKQNQYETAARDKQKKKNVKASGKKASKKYN